MAQSTLPLRPTVLMILLVLAERPRHGYGIMLAVRERSDGVIDLGTSHLYRHLRKLLDLNLVEETAALETDADSRRRNYCLTTRGREALTAEISRLASLVEHAHQLIRPEAS